MYKQILAVIAAVFILSQSGINAQNINKAGSVKWKYEITDTMLMFNPWDVAAYKNEFIFISDRYSKKIHKLDIKKGKFIPLSRNGSGPGEFEFPNNLFIYQNKIYAADYMTGKIQALDFNGKYSLKVDSKINASFWSPFVMIDNKAYIGQMSGPPYWVNGSDAKGHFPVEKCFKSIPAVYGGSAAVNNSNVYYINPFEFYILCLNTKDNSERTIELKGLSSVFSWKSYYSSKITKNEFDDIDKNRWILRPMRLFTFEKDKKLFFTVSYFNAKQNLSYFSVFNESGNCLLSVEYGNGYLTLFDIDSEVAKFYKAENGVLKGFYYFTLNKATQDKIK